MPRLDAIRSGPRPRPPKVIVYGPPKLGKSTFGASAPRPIFIPTEEGLDAIDTDSFPLAESYSDVLGCLRTLAREDHEYRTVVLDSADWTEPLIWSHVCEAHNVESIEQVGGGYGKGYVEAVSVWRKLLDGLDYLRDHRGMTAVIIAHDEVRKMEPPDSEAYDYASLKLHRKSASVLQEWADIIGYARLKTRLKKEDQGFGSTRARAETLDGGARVLHVGHHPAYVSGNRYGIEDSVALEWPALSEAMRGAFETGDNDE